MAAVADTSTSDARALIEAQRAEIESLRRELEATRADDEIARVLFEQSSDAHLIFDDSGIIDCNNAAVKMLLCEDKSQVLNLHPAVLSPERQPDGRRSLEKSVEMDGRARREGYHRFEWIHRRMNGELFPVEVTLTPVQISERPHAWMPRALSPPPPSPAPWHLPRWEIHRLAGFLSLFRKHRLLPWLPGQR